MERHGQRDLHAIAFLPDAGDGEIAAARRSDIALVPIDCDRGTTRNPSGHAYAEFEANGFGGIDSERGSGLIGKEVC